MARTDLSLARQEIPYDDSYQYWCGATLDTLIHACENEDQYLSSGEIIRALEDGQLEQASDRVIMHFSGQEHAVDVSIDWVGGAIYDDESSKSICMRIAKLCSYPGNPFRFVDNLDRICQSAGYLFTLQKLARMAKANRIDVVDGYIVVFDAAGHIIADGSLED